MILAKRKEILGVNYLLTSAVAQMQVEESGGIAIGLCQLVH